MRATDYLNQDFYANDMAGMMPPPSLPAPPAAAPQTMMAPPPPVAPDNTDYRALARQLQNEVGSVAKRNTEAPGMFDKWSDKDQFLMEMGLNMMAAGGRPGATLLGSLGEGATGAIKGARGRKKDKQAAQDKIDEKDLKMLGLRAELGRQGFDADQILAKFGYQQQQDNITNSQRDRALGLDEDRFNFAQYQFDNPDGQIIQDANGNFILASKRPGGESAPMYGADGKPIVGESAMDKLIKTSKLKAASGAAAQGDTPEEIQASMQALDAALNPAASTGTGGGGVGTQNPLQAFIALQRQKGYSDEQITSTLQKLQQQQR